MKKPHGRTKRRMKIAEIVHRLDSAATSARIEMGRCHKLDKHKKKQEYITLRNRCNTLRRMVYGNEYGEPVFSNNFGV